MITHNGGTRNIYLSPRHPRDPLLKGTMCLCNWEEEGCSQRSGEKDRGFGKIVGLLCIRYADILTGV